MPSTETPGPSSYHTPRMFDDGAVFKFERQLNTPQSARQSVTTLNGTDDHGRQAPKSPRQKAGPGPGTFGRAPTGRNLEPESLDRLAPAPWQYNPNVNAVYRVLR